MKKLMFSILMLASLTSLAQAQGTPVVANANLREDAVNGKAAGPIDDNSYIIGPEDTLTVAVWKEPELTQTVAVRPDGKISLPLLNDMQASGFTTLQLKEEISKGLQSYITDPSVTVIVQSARSRKASVIGEVARPGTYFINGPTTLVQLISLAGGFRDFAATNKITVIRQQNGKSSKINFNYKDFVKGKKLDGNLDIQPGDIIVVP